MKQGIKKKTNESARLEQFVDPRKLIEKRAYELWLADGCREGNDLHYWLAAEAELGAIIAGQSGISSTRISP